MSEHNEALRRVCKALGMKISCKQAWHFYAEEHPSNLCNVCGGTANRPGIIHPCALTPGLAWEVETQALNNGMVHTVNSFNIAWDNDVTYQDDDRAVALVLALDEALKPAAGAPKKG